MPTTRSHRQNVQKVQYQVDAPKADSTEFDLLRLKLESHNRILEQLVRGAPLENV